MKSVLQNFFVKEHWFLPLNGDVQLAPKLKWKADGKETPHIRRKSISMHSDVGNKSRVDHIHTGFVKNLKAQH